MFYQLDLLCLIILIYHQDERFCKTYPVTRYLSIYL